MDEAISRQEVIKKLDEALERITKNVSKNGDAYHVVYGTVDIIKCMIMTIQPDNRLQKLADEIASFKLCVKSENSDYLTGFLCALSVVEGMIADMREVTT